MSKECLHLVFYMIPSLLCLVLIIQLYHGSPPHLNKYLSSPHSLFLKESLKTECNSSLVSAYYRIPSKHSHEQYTAWMINFLSLTDCMIVFVQPDIQELVQALRPPSYPILIIPRPMSSFLVSSLLDDKGWDQQVLKDPEKDVGHSHQLYRVWNEKTNMLLLAAELNPFSSSYFLWLDIGAVRHEDYNHQQLVRVLPSHPGILLLQVEPFTPKEKSKKEKIDFSGVNRIGGGTIGGDLIPIRRWHSIYYNVFKKFLSRNRFVGKDQNLMADACLEEPNICLLVEGGKEDWFLLQKILRGERPMQYTKRDRR